MDDNLVGLDSLHQGSNHLPRFATTFLTKVAKAASAKPLVAAVDADAVREGVRCSDHAKDFLEVSS